MRLGLPAIQRVFGDTMACGKALILGIFLMLAALPAPAFASCRLALALALDVSWSVDPREYKLQLEGVAHALIAPEVRAAILSGAGRNVDLLIYEWSKQGHQQPLQDWVTIRRRADLEAVSQHLLSLKRNQASNQTALGQTMIYGATRLAERQDCVRKTLDISGDGMSNNGPEPLAVRDTPPVSGISINGLVIGQRGPALSRYYTQNVIRGPDAFVLLAADFEDFEKAMRRKLVRETAAQLLSQLGPHR